MDGGAWWAAVHGVSKSQTWLSDFTFTSHFHALEKEMATHSSVLAWRIPGTGEPGGLPSVGSHRVRHDWSDLAAAAASCYHTYNPLPGCTTKFTYVGMRLAVPPPPTLSSRCAHTSSLWLLMLSEGTRNFLRVIAILLDGACWNQDTRVWGSSCAFRKRHFVEVW